MKRKIITINEKKCNGCKLCIPNCPEGAIQIIDGKARLISDLFCDGLGACIGHCPKGAITIEEREAKPYDEKKVMENIVKQGDNVMVAHLEHLKSHGEKEYFKQAIEYLKSKNIKLKMPTPAINSQAHSCPGSMARDLSDNNKPLISKAGKRQNSQLRQWPVQLNLLSPQASYFQNADLLFAADCVPFAYANFHSDFLKDKILIIGCPKLDDTSIYEERLTEILKLNHIKSLTIVNMEVPCCFGLQNIAENAIRESGKKILLKQIVISVSGEKK